MKSSSSLSDLYFELLKDHFTNPEAFIELSLEMRVDLYEFKYDRFIENNDLTIEQVEAVLELKSHVQEVENNKELELSNDLVNTIYSNFSYEQGTFLIGYLGNSPIDYDPPTQTEGCWFCWRRVITTPCHEEFRDGESIGFYQTETMERHGAFGVRNSSRDIENVIMPCD
jgi:hypothetical protein